MLLPIPGMLLTKQVLNCREKVVSRYAGGVLINRFLLG